MSDVWAPGICRWFRRRALPRVTAGLCAGALFLNLFAPLLWIAAAPPPAADAPMAGHDMAAMAGHHHMAMAPMAGHDMAASDATSHPADPATPSTHHGPHCPLCVLFGGTAWAPPVAPAALLADAPQRAAPTVRRGETRLVALPTRLRPSPRAPPIPL